MPLKLLKQPLTFVLLDSPSVRPVLPLVLEPQPWPLLRPPLPFSLDPRLLSQLRWREADASALGVVHASAFTRLLYLLGFLRRAAQLLRGLGRALADPIRLGSLGMKLSPAVGVPAA